MTKKVFFNKLVTKSFNITDPKRRLFTGILSVEMKDKQGEIMVIDELMKVLPIWMKRGAPMSNTHTNQIVARGLNFQRVTVKDQEGNSYPGVEIMGEVHKDYQLDDDIWEKMKSGEYKGLSFGGATKADRIPTIWKDGSVAYKLVDLEQYEVAICKDAAVPLAFITDVNTLAKSISKSGKTIGYTAKNNNEVCIQCDNVGCYVEKADEYEEDKKLSPSDAGYVVLKEKSPHCGACIFYREGGSCTKVSGEIDPVHGCCNIFKGDPNIYKALYSINKPFAGYKNFAACVSANKDKGNPEAYCAVIMRQVEGTNKSNMYKCLSCGAQYPDLIEKCGHCGGKINKGIVPLAAVIDEIHDLAEPTEKTKGLVEDQAGQKCPHCGYIPSDGTETLEQHIQSQHPDLQGSQDKPSGIKNPSDDTREALNYDHQDTGFDTNENNDSAKTPETAGNVDPQDTSMSANDTNAADANNPLEPQKDKIIHPTANAITDPMRGMPLEVPVKLISSPEPEMNGSQSPLNNDKRPEDLEGEKGFNDEKVKPAPEQVGSENNPKADSTVNDGVKEKKPEEEPQKTKEKAARRISDHKQYADMQPDSAQVSSSTDTVYDPSPEKAISNQGDVGMGTFKSKTEKVPKEDAIRWWDIMNPSQRQHALDPNNWYDWSESISRSTFDELNTKDQKLVFATYAFRNDGKAVEGTEVEQLVPSGVGSPQTEGVGSNKADTSNINASPTPTQVEQNTILPDEKEKSLRKTLDNLRLSVLEGKVKNIQKYARKTI